MTNNITFLEQLGQDLREAATSEPTGRGVRRQLLTTASIALSALAVVGVVLAVWALPGGAGSSGPTRAIGNGPAPGSHPAPGHGGAPAPGLRSGPAPIPYGPVLTSVAGSGPADLWAVGDKTRLGSLRSIAVHYDGSRWTSTPVPNVGELRGVTALSPDDVWTFGAKILHWDGTGWSQSPMPKVFYPEFNAISASGPDDIWIVGNRGMHLSPNHIGRNFLAEHWDGTAWSVASIPDPNPGQDNLIDVVTLSPTDAWAVGQSPHGLTLHWDGSRWTRVPLPAALQGHAQMWGVGTDGQHGVWALGDGRGRGYGKQLFLRWTGHSWQLYPSDGTSRTASPSAISGSSASDLWAVGSAAGDRYMIARLNGKTWRNVQAATPGVPSYQINLGDVTTLSPTDAWAVGQTFGADHSASRRHPKLSVVILHWNGTDWTPIAVPGLSSLGTSVHN